MSGKQQPQTKNSKLRLRKSANRRIFFGWTRPQAANLMLLAIVMIWVVLRLDPTQPVTVDNGLKLYQLDQSFTLPVIKDALDPEGARRPVINPFIQYQSDLDRDMIVFPWTFPLLLKPFYLAGGKWGLRLAFLLAGLLMLVLLLRDDSIPWLAPWILLATPLLFYLPQLWEHFPAALLVLVGWRLRSRPGWLSLPWVVAVSLRPEIGVMLPVWALLLVWRRRWRALTVFSSATALYSLIWLSLNRVIQGSWLPLQVSRNFTHRDPLDLLQRLDRLILPLRSDFWLAVPVLVAVVGMMMVARFRQKTADTSTAAGRLFPLLSGAFVITGSVPMIILLMRLWQDEHLMDHLLQFQPLFLTAPLLLLALQRWKPRPADQQDLWLLVWISLGMTILLLPFFSAFHWGARWLLHLVPLLVILAGQTIRKFSIPVSLLIPFLLLSGALHLSAVEVFHQRQQIHVRTETAIQAAGVRVIVTDQTHFAGTWPGLLSSHRILRYRGWDDLGTLITTLQRAGVESFLLVHYNDISIDRQLHQRWPDLVLTEVVHRVENPRLDDPWTMLKFQLPTQVTGQENPNP